MFNNFVNKFKKFLSLFVSLCILTCFVNTNNIIFSSDNTIVHYDSEKELVPDDNLREAIKRRLIRDGIIENGNAVFTKEDLSNLERLNDVICCVSDVGMPSLYKFFDDGFISVKNLEGLQYCDSLTNLYLVKCDSKSYDFSKLPKNIKKLSFISNNFSSEDFSNLPQTIEKLNLEMCGLTEIPDVSNLKNLERLNLNQNNIMDVSNLDKLGDIDVSLSDQKVVQKTVLINDDDSVEFNVPKILGISGQPLKLITDEVKILNVLDEGEALIAEENVEYDEKDSRVFCRMPEYTQLRGYLDLLKMAVENIELRNLLKDNGFPESVSFKDMEKEYPMTVSLRCRFVDPDSTFSVEILQPITNSTNMLSFTDAYFQAKVDLWRIMYGRGFFSYQDRTYIPLTDRSFSDLNKINLLCDESSGMQNWYGLRIPSYAVLFSPFFYVEWVPYEKLKEKPEYNNLDESVKSKIDHDKCSMFYAGLIDCGGNKLDLDALFINEEDEDKKYVELYVEIGKNWDLEDLKSVYIADGPDEEIEVRTETVTCPDGQERTFGVLKLKHFSPYFIYDSKNSSVILNSTVFICVSSVVLVLALGSLFLIFKNKKKN